LGRAAAAAIEKQRLTIMRVFLVSARTCCDYITTSVQIIRFVSVVPTV
jgi:hypothetical protein